MLQKQDLVTIKELLNFGNQLRQDGKNDQAIEKYRQALQLNPNSVPALVQLAEIYEEQKELDQAFHYLQQAVKQRPKAALIHARLATVMMKQGSFREAITVYQKAIALQPKLPAWVYGKLANCLSQAGQINEAITTYQNAIELFPDKPNFYLDLAKLCAQKAIKLKPDLAGNWANILKIPQQEKEATLSLKGLNDKETYSKIWQALNQTTLESLQEISTYLPQEFDQNQVRQYFKQISQYKIINLTSITNEDQSYIESTGLSLAYLRQNTKLVTQEGVSEDIPKRGELQKIVQLALEEGYIYAICPTTGSILRSNCSLIGSSPSSVFYRFVGNEVFYLFCSAHLTKRYLYFPRLDLIVQLVTHDRRGKKYQLNEKYIVILKTLFVTNWRKVKEHISSENYHKVRKVIVIPPLPQTPWHQMLNHLAPVHELCQSGYLKYIDRLYIFGNKVPESYYGDIDEIFPEISCSKIERSDLTNSEIINDNLFVINIQFIWESQYFSNSLSNRIYRQLSKKCSEAFLKEVQQVRNECFPLLWINFRTHKRTWVSKVNGISSIIASLAKDFPSLCVVFDGFTRTDVRGKLVVNPDDISIIQQEKSILSQIRSSLSPDIRVYDLIGCPMHEVIAWAYAIDLYMVPVGSGLIKVRIPNKPGVVHSATLYSQLPGHEEMRENCIPPVPVPREKIIRIFGKETRASDSSYDFDWKIAYEELLKIASSIKRDQ